MGSMAAHPNGVFCWLELASSHADRAAAFYSALFDWTGVSRPGTPGFTIFQLDGVDVAAVIPLDAHAGPPRAHWTSYVSVGSLQPAVARATELGARPLSGPVHVPDLGPMATLEDPTGATFGLREMPARASGLGAPASIAPGTLCWTELATSDVAAAEAFYVSLFEWRSRRRLRDRYVEFLRGTEPVAGLLPDRSARSTARPQWIPYFAALDVDDLVDLACRQGGAVLVAPESIPMSGRFAVLRDAEGAAFGVFGVDEAA